MLNDLLKFKNISPNYFLGLAEKGLTVQNMFDDEGPIKRFQSKAVSLIPDFFLIIILVFIVAIIALLLYIVVMTCLRKSDIIGEVKAILL